MSAAAITADPVGVLIAFGAGILSFLSPCVLPLVPGYVSMVSGLSAAELEAEPDPEAASRPIKPVLRGIVLFVLGFTIVFTALGAAASGLGHLLGTHKQQLSVVAGALVVALGAVLLVGALPARVWAWAGSGPVGSGLARVVQERRFSVRPSALGTWGAPVMGMAFAFAWTPCIGPVLGAVTALAATRSTLAGGVVLLLAYSLGLAVPFVLTGLAFNRLTGLFARVRGGLWVVHLIGGVVLVVFGVLLLTGQLGWLATQMQDLMRHLGLGRLTTS
ncbi:MAG TPA: cytochrome c biogenesis protein CcdA [Acidimicrobiales bacterium]|nr:cytochrome c biogenesis protein CcdA [Acidimicrobiales bacterium]